MARIVDLMENTAVPIPRLSLVVVSWNRRDDLRVLLASIAQQDYPNMHTVVVDNGSTDGTADDLRAARDGAVADVFFGTENVGAARARNIGLRMVGETDYVAFLDSDAELVESDTLSRLVAHLERHADAVAVSPAIYSDAQSTRLWLLGCYMDADGYLDYDRCLRECQGSEFLSTCVSVWRARPIYETGGFDPAYPFGFEDYDLSVRVARHTGQGFAVLPDVRAIHHISKAGRPRNYATWKHQVYVERTTQRHRVLQLGARRYVGALAGRWLTPRGWRKCRQLHGGFGFGFAKIFLLWVWIPLLSLLNLPRFRREISGADWIERESAVVCGKIVSD